MQQALKRKMEEEKEYLRKKKQEEFSYGPYRVPKWEELKEAEPSIIQRIAKILPEYLYVSGEAALKGAVVWWGLYFIEYAARRAFGDELFDPEEGVLESATYNLDATNIGRFQRPTMKDKGHRMYMPKLKPGPKMCMEKFWNQKMRTL